MPKIRVKNFEINYEIKGEGFPLVMIMGLSANLDWWQPDFVEDLAKHFKVIIFDNRGAGRSDDPGVDFTVKTLAEDTVGLMDALKIPKAHILGISLGGMIAQEVALNFPKRVEKLVLAATMPGGPKQVPPGPVVIKLLGADRTKKTEEQNMADMIPILYTEGYAKSHPEEMKLVIQQFLKAPIKDASYQRQLKAIIAFDSTKRLKNIKMPTLIVHGKQDILIPPGNAKMSSELIKDSKFLLFDGSAHAVFSEEKDKVWPPVIDFLK